MKIDDVTHVYSLTNEEFEFYVAKGIFCDDLHVRDLTDYEVQQVGTVLLLKQADVSREDIANYLLNETKNKRQQLHTLKKVRDSLLESGSANPNVLNKVNFLLQTKSVKEAM